MNDYQQQQQAPVKAGEIYEVAINAVGEKGDGIARVKGFVLFVAGVKKGDFVKIKITKVLAKVGFAEVAGAAERPLREQRFATINRDELQKEDSPPEHQYEETDSFGEE